MRTLKEIEDELAKVRKEAEDAAGMEAEVYSRIVGYYRSVRNWNKGKREEYKERTLFKSCESMEAAQKTKRLPEAGDESPQILTAKKTAQAPQKTDLRLVLFVRTRCPACPGAKEAAAKLGIPVDAVDADTEDGLEKAQKMSVFSTPTAILVSQDGAELNRANNVNSIAELLDAVA
ncbi:MAG: hypothetical protein LBC53_04300 [Spirochaetaceae bacterium]|jgi:ribonucleoside-triphosphate reductase|nr:hypothetical protein [Spirochaetaceae bacterium]